MNDNPSIPQDDQTGFIIPASFAQQRLWFLDRLEGGSAHYNVMRVLDLRGALDQPALLRSFEALIQRHEALRTCFSEDDGQPVQLIVPELAFELPLLDLSGLSEPDREADIRRRLDEAAGHRFDLGRAPLFRWQLLRLGSNHHLLLLTFHHILSDGWSMSILNRELATLYGAHVRGEPVDLPELSIQYADFAVWQREWLQGDALQVQLDYWCAQLADVPALSLPTAETPAPGQGFAGATERLPVGEDLSTNIKALSRSHGVTLFMTLLATLQLLLGRISGQQDFAVGAPVAGRNRPEIEHVFGFFINSLVLRADLSGSPTFADLLKRVRSASLDAYLHQDLPFERLVEALKPDRDLGRNPFFDVLINLLDASFDAFSLPGLEVTTVAFDDPVSKLPLTFYIVPSPDQRRLELKAVYQTARFSADRVRGLLQQYRHLLQQIVDTPDRPSAEYSLVTPADRAVLPDPGLALMAGPVTSVVETFRDVVDIHGSRDAVAQGEHTWTYGALLRAAEDIALGLRTQDVSSGDVVAVTGVRSFGLVAGVLGVLMSGGVLLLIDPALPRRRRDLMMAEASAGLMLVVQDQGGPAPLESGNAVRTLRLGADDGQLEAGVSGDASGVLPVPSPEQVAYVFYTSGSTGVPKGVLGVHRSLAHFVDWQRTAFEIGPADRVGLLTGYGFDVILRDLFLPLLSGATLCLPPPDGMSDVPGWLSQERISVLHTVPSLAQSWLMDEPGNRDLACLRWVFMAGEPLTGSLVARWREAFPGTGSIVNLYGPTETTLAKCSYRVPIDCGQGLQPVGWSLPQSQALVLSQEMRLCGLYEPGEVFVRTPFRSAGYLNLPDQTRLRFIQNPYSSDPDDRLYRTGDRGHYRSDGALVITGRTDDQVKIRGVRVEPSEVSAVLARHPLVSSCVVVSASDESDSIVLLAYVQARPDADDPERVLRAYLAECLPAPMIPRAFLFLDRLPLLPSGKVDRAALPRPAFDAPAAPSPAVRPRDRLEQQVAGIWAEVFELETIGVEDDFFDLGGHSLLATRVLSRINRVFGVELPLRRLFEAPTVAGLSGFLRDALMPESEIATPPIVKRSRKRSSKPS